MCELGGGGGGGGLFKLRNGKQRMAAINTA